MNAEQAIVSGLAQHQSFTDIGTAIGLSRDAVRRRVAKIIHRLGLDDAPSTQLRGPLHEPVRPLAVPMPPAATETRPIDGAVTALLWGDTHIPHHDPAALEVVRQIAAAAEPSVLVHMGDLLDCYKLSRFDKNPEGAPLQAEIDGARQHLATMRLASPRSRFILLEGNHEDRLRRVLWTAEDTASQIMRLTKVREALTWPVLLGLEGLGIEFYPYRGQARQSFLPKWILTHGSIVRKFAGYSARGEWEKYGRSGSSGHTHRLGLFCHQDANGNHLWAETGCTCSLTPEYVDSPDWQQGCVFLTFEPETGAPQVEPVYIHRGLAVWRGKAYRA